MGTSLSVHIAQSCLHLRTFNLPESDVLRDISCHLVHNSDRKLPVALHS
jgi:hypothetical protein